jgi:uncharacterized membrane protein YfcA
MEHPTSLLSLFALAAGMAATGLFSGVLAGLLGVGGGIVIVPVLFNILPIFGVPEAVQMKIAVATSLATIIPTSIISARKHFAKGTMDMALLRSLAPAMFVGALAGTVLAVVLKGPVLSGIFAAVALLVAINMGFAGLEWRLRQTMPPGLARIGIGAGIGGFSAVMGIGGGTFGVPLMTLYGSPIHRAVGTASGLGVIIAVPAILGFFALPVADAPPYTIGAVNLPAFAAVILTTYMTTPWGAALAHRMNPAPLKRAFAAFLILVALNMLRKALGL